MMIIKIDQIVGGEEGIRLQYLTMDAYGSTPNAETDVGLVYSKDVSGNTELMYFDDSDQEIQLTSDGYLNLNLKDTTSSTTGIISKESNAWIHNFHHPTGDSAVPQGENTFVGLDTGNFTMGSTATETYHGSFNVGLGDNNLKALTTGYKNHIIGTYGGYFLTTGALNVGVGNSVLGSLTTGDNNVALGDAALFELEGGSDNIAMGTNAGRFITGGSTANETSGTSIYLGKNTKAFADGDANEIVIGYDATGRGSNTVTLGNSSIATTYLEGNIHFADGYAAMYEISTPTALADAGLVYTRDDGTNTELYYMDSYGGEIKITEDGYLAVYDVGVNNNGVPGIGLYEQSSDPGTAEDKSFVYTKDVNGNTELFYKDSDGNVTQITNSGAPIGVNNIEVIAQAAQGTDVGTTLGTLSGDIDLRGAVNQINFNYDSATQATLGLAETIEVETVASRNNTSNAIDLDTGSNGIQIASDAEIDLNSTAGLTWDGTTLDLSATAGAELDATTLSLDGTDTTNLTMTANDAGTKNLTISSINNGAGAGNLLLAADEEVDVTSDTFDVNITDLATFDANRLELGTTDGFDVDGYIVLQDTTTSTTGVIYKESNRFAHNFHHPTGDTAVPAGQNTFVGIDSGNFTMGSTATETYHGSYNTATGINTLQANTTGYHNVANGRDAVYSNTEGYHNIGVGSSALRFNTSGYYNVGVGTSALRGNTSGHTNIAMGYEAGQYITGGSTANETSNTSIYLGAETKASADGDTNEIVIGYDATGNGSNTATYGNSDMAAHHFTAGSLYIEDTEASDQGVVYKGSTRFMHNFHHPTGDTEVPVGRNTFMGELAGNFTMGSTATSTSHGSYNTGIGRESLEALTRGIANTGVGHSTLTANTSGDYNTAIGNGAGQTITTGYYNIYVGSSAAASASDAVNETVIGYNVTGKGSNTVAIGNSSVTANYFQGTINDYSNVSNLINLDTGTNGIQIASDAEFDVNAGAGITVDGTTMAFTASGDFVVNTNEFVVDSADGYIGFKTAAPTAPLHMASLATNDVAIKLDDGVGNVGIFPVDANPDGSVTGGKGSLALDYTNGTIYINIDGATDWEDIGTGTLTGMEIVAQSAQGSDVGTTTGALSGDIDLRGAVNQINVNRDSSTQATFGLAEAIEVETVASRNNTSNVIDLDTGSNGIQIASDAEIDLNATAGFTVDSTTMNLESTDVTQIRMTADNAADRTMYIQAFNNGAGKGHILINTDNDWIANISEDLDFNVTGVAALDAGFGFLTFTGQSEIKVDGSNPSNIDLVLGAHNSNSTARVRIDADDEVQFDSEGFDANINGAITMDGYTISLDSTDTTNLTMLANAAGTKTLTISATNAGAGESILQLTSDGKTASNCGSFDVNSTGNVEIDGAVHQYTSTDDMSLTANANSANPKYIILDANNAGAGTGNIRLNAEDQTQINTVTFDVNATGAVTVDGTTVSIDGTDTTNLTMTANDAGDKNLTISSINSGAGAGNLLLAADEEVDITSSTLDVNLSGGATLDATSFDITAAGGVYVDASGSEALGVDGYLRCVEISSPSAIGNAGLVYTKDDSGDTELFYMDDSGNEVQITQDGYLDVYNSVPGVGMYEQSSDPTTAIDKGFVYTKDASGVTELFYKNSDGDVAQLTAGGSVIAGTAYDDTLESTGTETTIVLSTNPTVAANKASGYDIDLYRNGVLMKYVASVGSDHDEWEYDNGTKTVTFVASGLSDFYRAQYRS